MLRRPRTILGLLAIGTTVALTSHAVSQQPAAPPAPLPIIKPVATVHGTIAISQDEFGKFLMDRGGADKLEIFVNKKIIEMEAAKRGLTVTPTELKAALKEDIAGLGRDGQAISEGDFVRVVLPKYGKSLYEWMEDIVRPRLLLTKMCRDRITITDANLKIQFERRFGEMRQVQMIMWPNGDDLKTIQKIFAKIRQSDADFDSEARQQANPGLAAACGHIKPITKHLPGDDKQVEQVAFQLKEGELSQILKTQQGYLVMKLVKIIPPNDKVQFEDQRAILEKAAFEARLEEEIPKCFAELRKAADPKFHFNGPAEWKPTGNVLDSIPDVIRGAGASSPVIPTPGAGK